LQVLVHCPKLQRITMAGCAALDTFMVWSDEVTELDLTGATC
jgi:hypothetical protein